MRQLVAVSPLAAQQIVSPHVDAGQSSSQLHAFSPLISGQAIDAFGFVPTYAGLATVAFAAAGLSRALPRAAS